MDKDSEDLVRNNSLESSEELDDHRITGSNMKFTTQEGYQRLFQTRWVFGLGLVSVAMSIALATIQVFLMMRYIPNNELYEHAFEYSGIGIVAGVLTVIAFGVAIWTSFRPTYLRLLLTLCVKIVILALHIGLILFATSAFLQLRWGWRSPDTLKQCDCVNGQGEVERKGTSPDSWPCRNDGSGGSIPKPLQCDFVDMVTQDRTWERSWLLAMMVIAGFQVITVIVSICMILRTFWGISRVFDKVAINDVTSATGETTTINFYQDYFPSTAAKKLQWVQFAFAIFTILVMIIDTSTVGSVPLETIQWFSIGSFIVMWTTLPESKLTYLKLSGIAYFHCFTTLVMFILFILICLGAFWYPRFTSALYLPFIAELAISGVLFVMSIRPIVKVEVDKLN